MCSEDTMTNKNRDIENQTIATECFLFSDANGTLDSLSDDSPNGRSNETLLATCFEWDDWDESLWTPDQRKLLMEQGAVPRRVHIFLGILLALVALFGIIANSIVLFSISR